MKRVLWLAILLSVATLSFSQKYPTVAPNPHKAALERLRSITEIPLTGWTGHAADFPHPEDVATSTYGWTDVKVDEPWKNSAFWVRKTVEIPEQGNGYALKGATVRLDFWISSNESVNITVFSNGNMVSRSDEDAQLPIVLTNDAQPGQKFEIASRVLGAGEKTRIYRARLLITPPSSRPDPGILADEIESIHPLIQAYSEGKEARDKTLAAAVGAIDFAALDKSDQSVFDASLRKSQQTLEQLRPYIKKFSIHTTGNSHIDM